jgi:hypothetical protein
MYVGMIAKTTESIERSHTPTRDRLRSSRGMKTVATGQRIFARFGGVPAPYPGHVGWDVLATGHRAMGATPLVQARAVVAARRGLGARHTRAARSAG